MRNAPRELSNRLHPLRASGLHFRVLAQLSFPVQVPNVGGAHRQHGDNGRGRGDKARHNQRESDRTRPNGGLSPRDKQLILNPVEL